MLNSRTIQNVIKLAGKVEAPVTPAGTAPAKEKAAPGVVPEAVRSYVLYFYYAPEDKAINFPTIQKDLTEWTRKKNDPAAKASSQALLEKLKSKVGTTEYSAGFFSWKKVFIVTNKYGGKYIVYSAGIKDTGVIEPGTETITPDIAAVTPEMLREEFNVFKNGVLNIQTSTPEYEVYYHNGNPRETLVNELLANPSISSKGGESYDTFSKKVMDKYRIWTGNRLVRPDFKQPTNDGVPGNYYPGGYEAFKKIILPMAKGLEVDQEAPKAPSPPTPPGAKEKEEESMFQAVGEIPKTSVKGQYLYNPSGGTKMASKESTKGDYSSEPYSGGFDVMKRLVKDQHLCMKIRKCAKNVVLGYLKEAQYSTVMPGTKSQAQGTYGNIPMTFTLGKTVQQSIKNKQNMEKAIKMQKDQEKLVRQTMQHNTQPVMQPVKT